VSQPLQQPQSSTQVSNTVLFNNQSNPVPSGNMGALADAGKTIFSGLADMGQQSGLFNQPRKQAAFGIGTSSFGSAPAQPSLSSQS
jgi:hypothetical protein